MKRAAVYLRVSTEGQTGEDRYGLPAQKEAVESYAKSKGFSIVAWYEDDGISGATIDRPGLQDMITDAGADAFDLVLVAKMDRIARDVFVALFVEKKLLEHDVEIHSVSEPISGKDPMNTAFRQMMAVFAELEKSMITARMSGGRRQKARGGGYAGGGAAIGYTAARGQKVLELDTDKINTVKRVFQLREEYPGNSLQQIADQLNMEGHTTAQGAAFSKVQVKRILDRREFYSGTYVYSDITTEKGLHQAII